MMKRFALLIATTVAAASPAWAADLQFSGTAKIKPTYYGDFDFDSSLNDKAALNEGGWANGEHVRAELRLGFNAKGDKWTAMMILEGDIIMEKDTADRSFYGAPTKNNATNAGAEFGIERAEFSYAFAPALKLSTGWNIRALDIATGGAVFGDDHPFIELSGSLAKFLKYQLGYLQIQNRSTAPPPVTPEPGLLNDWRAYYLRIPIDVGGDGFKLTVAPFAAKSDNEARFARANYFGAELTGQVAFLKPYAEFAYVTGDFDLDRRGAGTAPVAKNIESMTGFLGLEIALGKAFSPYAAARYTQGDDDATDSDAKGFVGITDIGRFTGLIGMDGNILGEHLASGASPYGSPLYSYSPERAGPQNNFYGGIGNGGTGNNPGQRLLALGVRGDLGDVVKNLSYKAQAFYIMYDETGNLVNLQNPGQKVDDVVGTEFDLQIRYAFSKEFAIDIISSMLLPGDGIKDQLSTTNDAPAQAHTLTLAWTY